MERPNEFYDELNSLKTIDVQGKPYVPVSERLRFFRKWFAEYSLTTTLLPSPEGTVRMRAEIADEGGRPIASGTAEEREGEGFINKGSYIENCETSCWGRALACLGIGVETSVASADEVKQAVEHAVPAKKPETNKDYKCEMCKVQVVGKVLEYSLKKHNKVLCYECQKK